MCFVEGSNGTVELDPGSGELNRIFGLRDERPSLGNNLENVAWIIGYFFLKIGENRI